MASYEMTITMSHISTSDKQRLGDDVEPMTLDEAKGAACASIAYVTRDASENDPNVMAFSQGQFLEGDTKELKKQARDHMEARAERFKNQKYGVRLCDKLIVSFPNDATIEEQRKMMANIMSRFCGDSEALAIGAIHTDCNNNNHGHIDFFDGKETKEAARARRPEAKRVRQGEHLRFNEVGGRKKMRAAVAEEVNAIGQREGRRVGEHLSYEERGIAKKPQKHEGVALRQKVENGAELTDWEAARIDNNFNTIAFNIKNDPAIEREDRLEAIPKRWSMPQFLNIWGSKLGILMKRTEANEQAQKQPANTQTEPKKIFRRFPKMPSFLGPDKTAKPKDGKKLDGKGQPILKPQKAGPTDIGE